MSVPPRTTLANVQAILQPQNWDGFTDLSPFIEAASLIVDQLVYDALNNKVVSLVVSPSSQEMIERWLSAHFYQMADPGYSSRSTAGGSGSFDGGSGDGFEGTRYGRMAIRLDFTNMLRSYDKQQIVGGAWLGVDQSMLQGPPPIN